MTTKAKTTITEEHARNIAEELGETLLIPPRDFFVADHTHEELSAGAWSIAYEGWTGDTPWPVYAAEILRETHPEVFAEPLSSWGLAIYPSYPHD